MLLAFISQIMVAATITCELEKAFTPGLNIVHEGHMDHSAHELNSMQETRGHEAMEHRIVDNADQPSIPEHQSFCCKSMADCLLGCALITINNNFLFHLKAISSGVEDFYSSTTSNPFIPSLYRPPIFG
jgi:hypothetical protein